MFSDWHESIKHRSNLTIILPKASDEIKLRCWNLGFSSWLDFPLFDKTGKQDNFPTEKTKIFQSWDPEHRVARCSGSKRALLSTCFLENWCYNFYEMQPLFRGILLCAHRGMMTWRRLMTRGCDASSLPLSVETQRAAGRLRSSSCPLKHKRPVVFWSHVPAGGLEHRNFPTVGKALLHLDVCFTLLVVRWQVDGRRQDAVEAAAGVSAASGEQQPARQPGRRLQRSARPRWVRMWLSIHVLTEWLDLLSWVFCSQSSCEFTRWFSSHDAPDVAAEPALILVRARLSPDEVLFSLWSLTLPKAL